MFEQNTVSIIKYIINWIICEKNFPNPHNIFLQGCSDTRTIYFLMDNNENIHVSNLENFKIFIEKHPEDNWNIGFCYKYLKHLLKKTKLFNHKLSLILEKFLSIEFGHMKQSIHEFKYLCKLNPKLKNIFSWFKGYYILDSKISEETLENFIGSINPLLAQFVNQKDQERVAFILQEIMLENFSRLQTAIHSEMDIDQIILSMKQQTNFNIDQHFKFIQTKDVDFRTLFLNLFDIHLHLIEIENNTFSLMLRLQVILSLAFPENVMNLKNEVVCSSDMLIDEFNYEKMMTIHPILRGSFLHEYCNPRIVKIDETVN